MTLGTTPSQTVGPFFSIGLPWPDGPFAVPEGTEGAFWIRGRVFDGAGDPVPDALVETWQAGSGHRGFARAASDADGNWAVYTVKAPYVAVSVFARGLLNRVVTRIYFADEPAANAADPVLAGLDEAARATLLAEPADGGYRFDVHLQGPDETVFFAV
jgi:protocatechuate 3,4-dioxygenase, alpha subunit